MTPEECAHAVGTPINLFGTKWMFEPESYARARELGFGVMDFYVCGRAGGIPGITAEEVADELGIFGRDSVIENWTLGSTRQPVKETVVMFGQACADAGRRHLSDDESTARVGVLAGRVADAADPDGIPIFASWQRLPVPADVRGRAAHRLNALRELRGCSHLIALREADLSPLEAVVYRAGPDLAQVFGNQPPLPEVTDEVKAKWYAAEAATDAAVAPAFDALSEVERDEFASLVNQLLT